MSGPKLAPSSAGPILALLKKEHEEMDQLFQKATADPLHFDTEAYDAFRALLLRHIGIEEKILFRALRKEASCPEALLKKLNRDHAALGALLVAPPKREVLDCIAEILEEHNPLEDGPNGLYQKADKLFIENQEALLEEMKARPEARIAAFRDSPKVWEHIRRVIQERQGKKERPTP